MSIKDADAEWDKIKAERDAYRVRHESYNALELQVLRLTAERDAWIKQAAEMEADRDDLRRFAEWVAREYADEVAGKEARRILGDLAVHRRGNE